jgi:very-short-patch-repair endonuclease
MIKSFQKNLRQTQTDAEELLWYRLRNRHFEEFKFRRQVILQNYIVDFVCFEKRLIVEVDGEQHIDNEQYDAERTKKFEQDGFKVLRYWNNAVLQETEIILENIYDELISRKSAKKFRKIKMKK